MIYQNVKQLYNVKVTEIGKDVPLFAEEKMIILFNHEAPAELRDICILHTAGELTEPLQAGDVVRFDDKDYPITAVGGEANRTLAELGHVTLKFDGSEIPALPGTVHLEDKPLPTVQVGTTIRINRPL